ncbi:sesquiterpene cyclase [Streptomyces sp. TRM72054]|uniref:(-)-alpha-amorphene synthase n=1 Tax=Streptomyces sp. TRM72054 TaxID=2870562 RepID=UPI001C8BC135|nr:(-)-alpha-amorphene synthase [Streptomyces sp. TRM72054]MBX9394595.1 sesquiterpene cyclase [Streptomyces sp. TRM72054]
MPTVHQEIPTASHSGLPGGTLKELIDASLYMPFPFLSNPHESEVAAGVDAWLRAWGLTDDPAVADMIVRTRPAQLASYNSPTVNRDILQIVANQIAYQFIFDDRAEEVGRRWPGRLLPMLCESIGILRDGQPPSTPLGAALTDLCRQVQERCTPAQAARWSWRSREYVHGLLYESVAQTHSVPISTGVCTTIRSLTAGVEPFYPLYEAAQSREVAAEEFYHPVMERLRRLSVDSAVWTADLFSAVKEQRAGGMINLALAHQRARQCSLPVAVRLAIRQINDTIREFEKLYDDIEPELSPAGVGYVEGMVGWIRGCYYWSRTVPRYTDATVAPVRP